MPNQIKDGTGRGYLVAVGADNRLEVHSQTVELIHFRSIEGDAYIIPMRFTQTSSGVQELAGTFMYTGSRTLIFHTLTVSSQETGIMELSIYAGTTPLAGGAAVAPVNLNTTSSKTLLSTVLHQNDGASPFTPYYQGLYLFEIDVVGGGMQQLKVDDSFIIKPNVPLGLYIKCTNAGSRVRPSVTCYEYDIEYK